MATGFQMIAQLSDSSEVHKLHINQSMDLQTPVTVEVEESGVYQVTIILIIEDAGIVGSGVRVEYAEEVMVDIITPTITPTGTPTFITTTLKPVNAGGIIAGGIIAVCVCVCMRVCMHVHVCVHACVRACVHVCC